MTSDPIDLLIALAGRWRAATRPFRWRAAVALLGLAWLLALLAARVGTWPARTAGALLLVASVGLAAAARAFVRRRSRDAAGVVRGPVRAVDPAAADRALRALSLARVDPHGTSHDLARLHLARVLAALPSDSVLEGAARRGARLGGVAVAVAAFVGAVALWNEAAVLEGADVLFARGGVAPFGMTWLGGVEVSARPPDYLHQGPIQELERSSLLLPYGTAIAVRGRPVRPGRKLLLVDGAIETPFVEDGAGAVVARYTLTESRVLRVVARFGDVVIPEPTSLPLASVPDAAPVVQLDGAPREVKLYEATDDIPVKYVATDDHGLREVHLVLRSGTREERRVLSHFDGESQSDEGGRLLRLRDPFFLRSHTPVEITVEAKDNDPLTGPKWGASAAISVVPAEVGESEARRLDALRELRAALVDTLAIRMKAELPSDVSLRSRYVEQERNAQKETSSLVSSRLDGTWAGVRVPGRIRALLGAQAEKTTRAVDAELRAPTQATRAAVVGATERFALVCDAVVVGLGRRDSRDAAKVLAEVADDLAVGLAQLRNESAEPRRRGEQRAGVAGRVLSAGGQALRRLGQLGRDLGEIVEADLARVARAREGQDYAHAELAARDLAMRLRQPDPSFGSRGGASARGGGESGGGASTEAGDPADASDEVEQAFQEAAQDLERLMQDHAGEIGKMEQALSGAMTDREQTQARDEAKKHAEAVREAGRELPAVGRGSDSWTSKAASARDLAEQMARALEQGRADHAVEGGRSAAAALDEAKKMLQRGGWFEDLEGKARGAVDDVLRKLEKETRWAEDQASETKRRAAERAREPLRAGGEEEARLADRAGELRGKGRNAGSFPEKALDSIEDAERAARDAAEALQRGDAERGLERQHDAQRSLEAAREAIQGQDDEGSRPSSGEGDGSQPDRGVVAIPNAGAHKGPEEFRRRVVRGLGSTAGSGLREAVQRYAQGLLR